MNANETTKPAVYPVLPLKNGVLFPGIMMPLVVGRDASIAAVEEASSSEDKTLVVAGQTNEAIGKPEFDDLYRIGTLAVIKKMDRSPSVLRVIVQGRERISLVQDESGADPTFLQARVARLPVPDDSGTEVEALHREILARADKVVGMIEPQAQAGLNQIFAQFKDPLSQVYLLASMLPLSVEKEQALLAANTRVEALRLMVEYITHETHVLELRQKIASQAESVMTREQREYLLRQQLREIQEELGETGSEQAAISELRDKLAQMELPDEVTKETERELGRLEHIPVASPEHQMTRGYIELILELPWNKATEDNLDLDHAQSVLDEDHYDLKDVKDRIIEQLAVMKLNPQAKVPILCFVGPPGVGKTSLGKSIARSLGANSNA